MKMRERHIVPLSQQALALVRQVRFITGSGKYIFPSLRDNGRPMSNNTVTAALRRLGYTGREMTAHGFRAMASTCLNELGWHPDLIELQHAHVERNKVRAAYNRAERLNERRKMMQAWADHLDTLHIPNGEAISRVQHAINTQTMSNSVGSLPDNHGARQKGPKKPPRTRHGTSTQLKLF